MNKKIFWIASFPKSGNTLVRAILASLFFSKNGKFSFNLLNNIKQLETFKTLDFIKKENPVDYKNLSDLKVLSKYFLKIQDKIIFNLNDNDACFLKTHSAFFEYFGNQFTTNEKTLGYIYIVRDPRDVALSLSHHMNVEIDKAIKFMLNKNASIKYTGTEKIDIDIKPPMMIGSWDLHLNSWGYFNVPKVFIKYEDLILYKKKTIIQIINFFKKTYNFKFNNIDEKIENILLTTEFNTMKKNELKFGFNEIGKNNSFFNIGKVKQWEKKLTISQINLIEKNFKKEMKKLNYL